MKKYILLFFLLKFYSAEIQAQSVTSFDTEFNWLEGTWIIETDGGTLVEEWTRIDSISYKAIINFLSSPEDKVESNPLEEITLVLRNKNIYFISIVKGQNNNLPVEFIFTGEIGGSYIFENLKHDFPQKIKYTPVGEKNMHAKIEGLVNGKIESSEFNYTKQ